MKSSTIRILICLIAFAGSKELSAQSADPNVSNYTQVVDILPPSPNAASLGKFGGLNTNLSSGMINTGIPIYEYKSTNITVPISLRYSSNGTRIDEIAGRVGTGWSLEAGGVITRTVMGRPDDKATRTIPTGFSSRSDIDMIDALCVGVGGTADAQPDLFSFNFNGNSGKFILDSSFNPILLTHSGLKIESAFDANSNLTFKFTTVDGVQYCFDNDSAMETTGKRQQDCGHQVPQFLTTAWYLSRIIHPNHDTVSFIYSSSGSNYKVGISQSIFQYNSQYTPPPCDGFDNIPIPSVQNSTCLSWLQTSGQDLAEIRSTGGGSIKFEYGQRIDMSDGLLTGIKVYQPGATSPCKVFTLQYQQIKATHFMNSYSDEDSTLQYRPFLTAFSEESPDGALSKNYRFSYNDPGGLAPRLSYAQDDYGFFNGKNNNTMIPRPDDPTWRLALPLATADRSTDVSYASKGMLSKIVYPTGGQDSIVYESNTVYVNQPIYEDPIAETVTGESDQLGPPVTDTTPVFHVYFDQATEITGSCQLLPGHTADAIHDKATVSLTDEASGVQVFSQTLGTGDNADEPWTLSAGHDYQLKVTVSGAGVAGAVLLQYIPDTPITHWVNKPVGGVRVQKLITQGDPYAQPTIKHYYYNRPNDTASSGSFIQQPVYQKPLFDYVSCNAGDCHCSNPPTSCEFTNFYYYSMYSNSLNTIYLYSGTPVCYSKVYESSGDNFENGGTRHDFFINPDNLSSPVLGDVILGAPLTSFDWISGQETYQCVFRNQSGTFIPVKQIYTHYNDDSTVSTSYPAFVTNKKYQPNCKNDPPNESEVDAYDVSEYLLYRKWVYADSVRTLTYDGNGVSYVEQDVATQYANKTHALPTQISRGLSDGRTETIHNYYPSDLTLSGDAEAARQNMVAQHILSPVLQQQVSRGGTQTFLLNANYHIFGNGLVLPSNYVVQTLNNSPEERVDFSRYTTAGKISEQYKTYGRKQADIWDYHHMYLIAQATNADSASVAFTSFETDGTGNWSIVGGSVDTMQAIAGRNSYQGGTLSKSGLDSATTYVVSYWSQNGAYNIPGTILGYPHQGKTINFRSPGWTFYVHKVTGQSTISVSSTGTIDELRLYPATAQMTTYTYDPLIGITSQTDAGNRISYYEYDGLSRLKRIRDQDYNILKSFDYQYQGTQNCGSGCYAIAMQTANGAGSIGYPVGVFDIHDKLLGNAHGPTDFVGLWNSDTADSRIGTLAVGNDSLHFNITLNTGQTLPSGVTGRRYYQWDLPWNVLDGIMLNSGAYVDFGDGTGMTYPTSATDTAGLAPNTSIQSGYIVHTYPDTSLKTITIYHNDGNEIIGLDNANNPATSLNKASHLRGYFPQHTTWGKFSSMQQASALTFDSIYNWNSITSFGSFNLNTGDGGRTQCRNVSFAQDFMKNNPGLQAISTSFGGYASSGVYDTTFKISRLKSGWNTYFTQLNFLEISDDHWNREDLSALKHLQTFAVAAGNHDGYGSLTPIPASVSDNIINQIATGAGPNVSNGVLVIWSDGGGRTSASNAAVTLLDGKGWTIYMDGVIQ